MAGLAVSLIVRIRMVRICGIYRMGIDRIDRIFGDVVVLAEQSFYFEAGRSEIDQ